MVQNLLAVNIFKLRKGDAMKLRKLVIWVVLQIIIVAFISCESGKKQDESAETTNQRAELSAEQRLQTIKSHLKRVKADLSMEGDYDCCIQPGCDWCVLHEDECECHDNLTAGKEVCPGCGLGWHNGKGVVKGVEASQVKWNITHEHGEAAEHGESEDGGEDHKEDGHKH